MTSITIKSNILDRAILCALSQFHHFNNEGEDYFTETTRLRAILELTKLARTVDVSVEDVSVLLSFTPCIKILEEGRI